MVQRIKTYDIAKGIGIILVYLGHVPPCLTVRKFIYTFHMPLFFLISGMLLNVDKYDAKSFLTSRIKSLIIPSFTFVLFSNIVLYFVNHTSWKFGLPAIIWFLPVLFISEILIFLLWKKVKSFRLRISLCICFLLVAIFFDYIHFKLPVALNVTPLASFFLAFGNIFKDKIIKYTAKDNNLLPYVGFGLLFLCSFLFRDYNNMHKGHLILMGMGVLLALIGVISLLSVSKVIEKYKRGKLLILFGKNSLAIYGFHLTLITAFGVPRFSEDIYQYFLLNICIAIILIILIYLTNKYARFLLGKF